MKEFEIKPKIYFDEGSLEYLREIKSKNAFILSDSIMEKLGYLKQAVDYLESAGVQCDVFTEIKPEPGDNSPQTGDTSNLMPWIALLLASGGVLTGVTVFDKRKRHSAK